MRISLRVNGVEAEADCWEGESLLYALREKLGYPGSKNACEQGECGSCSVLLDGTLVCACLVLAAQADGHDVTTVEGLADGDDLHPVQQAFVEAGAVQCGFCTPGPRRRDRRPARADRRIRPTTRSARRSPATSAAAPATRRSSTRSGMAAHELRRVTDHDARSPRSRSAGSATSCRAPTARRRPRASSPSRAT